MEEKGKSRGSGGGAAIACELLLVRTLDTGHGRPPAEHSDETGWDPAQVEAGVSRQCLCVGGAAGRRPGGRPAGGEVCSVCNDRKPMRADAHSRHRPPCGCLLGTDHGALPSDGAAAPSSQPAVECKLEQARYCCKLQGENHPPPALLSPPERPDGSRRVPDGVPYVPARRKRFLPSQLLPPPLPYPASPPKGGYWWACA